VFKGLVDRWLALAAPPPDPSVELMRVMAENQRLQQENHRKQIELFEQWLGLFKQPAADPNLPGPSQSDADIRDMLELSAELGNPEAADILADEKRLSAYVRYTRASQ
jgi:hypothetical protein